METSLIFRRALQAILPATLLLTACGKDDDPVVTPPTPQGRVAFFHAAGSADVSLQFLVDDVQKAALTYGQSASYQSVNSGAHTMRVVSAANTVATQQATVDADKSYSYFVYSPTATTISGLFTTDDLAAPSSGKAKIRFVNLGQGSASPLKLSTTVATVTDIPGTETAFGASSNFVEILPGSYNIAVTSGSGSTVITNVGDGSGAGTAANKAYDAGKIYTVVYRGISGSLVAARLQPQVILLTNN
jgi:hypothetical protein